MTDSKKINTGSVNILKFLQLLYEDKATYSEVLEIFTDKDKPQSMNNIQVQLNKYLNALKIFGFEIVKEKHKYKLAKRMYKMKFEEDDIKALSIILSVAVKIPGEKVSQDLKNLVNMFRVRMSRKDRCVLRFGAYKTNYEFAKVFDCVKDKINLAEKVCTQDYNVELKFLKDGNTVTVNCFPKEVIYSPQNVTLKVYDTNNFCELEIPVKNIISINTATIQKAKTEHYITVVYKLKNMLAKRYKLKENERLSNYEEDGSIVIINTGENQEKLIRRLCRYAQNCEVLTPKSFKNKMIKALDKAIENYQNF